MKPVVIQKFEYQTLRVGESGFAGAHFERLAAYNDLHQSRFFVVGHNRITFLNFVGVIHTGNLTIEILPKIDRHYDDKRSMRDLLVKMLHRTGDFPLEKTEAAWLHKTSGSLFELYLRLFLRQVRELVSQGLPKHYSSCRSNESFIRGRLLLPEQLKYNLIRKERNFVEYKRYSPDHLFNRILKQALTIIFHSSGNLGSEAAELLAHFEHVSDQMIVPSDFLKLCYSRKTECYRPSMALAELIITGFQPDLKHGELHVAAFLFDMNLLFERYIADELRRECRKAAAVFKMRAQVSKVFWRHSGGNSRKMIRPDIVLETPSGTFVLDTKWKIPDDVYSDDGDLKQLYTYSLQFESPHVFLIYPASTGKHALSHGSFQPSKNSAIHTERPVTQWKVPLLDHDGCLNLGLGKELLSSLQEFI